MTNNLEIANRKAKGVEIWDSGVISGAIWDAFDLVMSKVITGLLVITLVLFYPNHSKTYFLYSYDSVNPGPAIVPFNSARSSCRVFFFFFGTPNKASSFRKVFIRPIFGTQLTQLIYWPELNWHPSTKACTFIHLAKYPDSSPSPLPQDRGWSAPETGSIPAPSACSGPWTLDGVTSGQARLRSLQK